MTTGSLQKILLVEDNDDDYDLTLRAFKKAGLNIRIERARDGGEALDYFNDPAKSSILPNVVLLDLNLPRISGHEVLRQIRADPKTRRLPVVVLTTSREHEDLTRSYDLGANSCIRKPVDFVEFIETVQTVTAYWLNLNETPGAF